MTAGRPTDNSTAEQDRHHLADAIHVVHGEKGTGSVRQAAYAVYVSVLLAFTYGFTIARGIFATSDARWIREGLSSPVTWGVSVATAVAVGLLARRAGRERGPITPPLPWVDHVAAGPIDRARTLGRWWAAALVGGVTGGALLGGVVGGGLFASGAGGPAWLTLGAIGAVAGFCWARAWLSGQWASTSRNRGIGPVSGRATLRQLPMETVRAHSSRAGRLHGAVLAGDLRAARLEVATPVTRARNARLRPGRPLATVIRRDVLGLRRAPGSLAVGLALIGAGAAVLGWRVVQPNVPWALVPLGALAAYLGFGGLSGGLRYHGDTAGTPPLSGLDFRTEALAHLIAPAGLHAAVACTAVGAVGLTGDGPLWGALARAGAVGLLTTGLVAGGSLMAAFRGSPPTRAFIPESGPTTMLMWYARPAVATIALISLTVIVSGPLGPAFGSAGTLALWLAGASSARRLELAHRV